MEGDIESVQSTMDAWLADGTGAKMSDPKPSSVTAKLEKRVLNQQKMHVITYQQSVTQGGTLIQLGHRGQAAKKSMTQLLDHVALLLAFGDSDRACKVVERSGKDAPPADSLERSPENMLQLLGKLDLRFSITPAMAARQFETGILYTILNGAGFSAVVQSVVKESSYIKRFPTEFPLVLRVQLNSIAAWYPEIESP